MKNPKIPVFAVEGDENAQRMITNFTRKFEVVTGLIEFKSKLLYTPGAFGVLEVNSKTTATEMRSKLEAAGFLAAESNNQCRLVAVTDPDFSQFTKQLLISGFSRVFCSHVEGVHFRRMIENHIRQIRLPGIPLEQQFWTQIPWVSHSQND